MFGRQRQGAFICRSCGRLVGVNDAQCLNCGARNPALWGFAPALRRLGVEVSFFQLVMLVCGGLYAASLVAAPEAISSRGLLGLLSPGNESLLRFGASGAWPVRALDRWWTVLSAGWLHGSLLHLVFNMMWVRQVGPLMLEAYGTARTILLYCLSSAIGFLFSSYAPSPPIVSLILGGGGTTVGASAAIFGLLGALIYYSRRGGASALGREVWGWAIFLFVFGLIAPRVDNWAHLGGFVGGYGLGRVLDPLKPERLDHLLGAVLCLVATVVAVVTSLLVPLPQV